MLQPPFTARSVEIASSQDAPRNNSANLIDVCFNARFILRQASARFILRQASARFILRQASADAGSTIPAAMSKIGRNISGSCAPEIA